MSKFKDMLSVAYELGFAGNTWNDTCVFLNDSSFGKILEKEDFSFDGMLYENYISGRLDFENENPNPFSL